MTTAQQDKSSPPEANGNGPENTLAAAIAYEQGIADEAALIREKALFTDQEGVYKPLGGLSPDLFAELYSLLRRPIPPGYIEHVGETTGKPYDSTGVRSVQVQIDRLNNVLTPLWWHFTDEYEQEGKLCKVTVTVDVEGNPRSFSSYGGMNRGSTVGNLYKGSFTNAAKLAIARLGPGWEVYVGAADFDPDTDKSAANAQEASSPPPVATIDGEAVAELVAGYEALKTAVPDKDKLARDLKVMLGSIGVPTPSLNKAFGSLTPTQRDDVSGWLASYGNES